MNWFDEIIAGSIARIEKRLTEEESKRGLEAKLDESLSTIVFSDATEAKVGEARLTKSHRLRWLLYPKDRRAPIVKLSNTMSDAIDAIYRERYAGGKVEQYFGESAAEQEEPNSPVYSSDIAGIHVELAGEHWAITCEETACTGEGIGSMIEDVIKILDDRAMRKTLDEGHV